MAPFYPMPIFFLLGAGSAARLPLSRTVPLIALRCYYNDPFPGAAGACRP